MRFFNSRRVATTILATTTDNPTNNPRGSTWWPEIKKNIIMEYYEAGHMMYTHKPSLIKFKKDVAEFIKNTSVRP